MSVTKSNDAENAFLTEDAIFPTLLKTLEENGLVQRIQYESIPPRVEYRLTDMGEKFRPVIAAMEAWGNEYINYLAKKEEP